MEEKQCVVMFANSDGKVSSETVDAIDADQMVWKYIYNVWCIITF